MDELEIGGQRYLSTRRAGKEHKYHSDYIGQLIRGGKVVGKKVGRSWYVEEASLNTYLSGEDQRSKPVVKTPSKTAVKQKEEAAPVVVQKSVEVQAEEVSVPTQGNISEEVVEQAFTVQKNFNPAPVRRVPLEEERKIKITTPTLQYVSDDTPVLPIVPQKKFTQVVSEEVPTYEPDYLPSVAEVTRQSKTGLLSLAAIAVIGILVFSLTAGVSMVVSFETVVEEGQTAGVGYTLK